jgi:hypothetical protein
MYCEHSLSPKPDQLNQTKTKPNEHEKNLLHIGSPGTFQLAQRSGQKCPKRQCNLDFHCLNQFSLN